MSSVTVSAWEIKGIRENVDSHACMDHLHVLYDLHIEWHLNAASLIITYWFYKVNGEILHWKLMYICPELL